MGKNGYFRLDMRSDGVYLNIIPEEDEEIGRAHV